MLDAVFHEGLVSSLTFHLGFICPLFGCRKQIRMSSRLVNKLVSTGVVLYGERIESQQVVL